MSDLQAIYNNSVYTVEHNSRCTGIYRIQRKLFKLIEYFSVRNKNMIFSGFYEN